MKLAQQKLSLDLHKIFMESVNQLQFIEGKLQVEKASSHLKFNGLIYCFILGFIAKFWG